MARRPFRRRSDGTLTVNLSSPEREALAAIAAELREMLADGSDDTLRRLFPPAYADDEEHEGEYQSMVHDELLRKRLEDLDILEQTTRVTELTDVEAQQWMHAINGLRLVLGTRLDVTEEMEAPGRDDPAAGAFGLYEYLGYLLENLLAALKS